MDLEHITRLRYYSVEVFYKYKSHEDMEHITDILGALATWGQVKNYTFVRSIPTKYNFKNQYDNYYSFRIVNEPHWIELYTGLKLKFVLSVMHSPNNQMNMNCSFANFMRNHFLSWSGDIYDYHEVYKIKKNGEIFYERVEELQRES
jgi:hypothetical protein